MDRRLVLFLFNICISVSLQSAETGGFPGKCPDVAAVEGFDPTKMPGRWYSIYETGKEKSCIYYDYKQVGPTDYRGFYHHEQVEVSLSLKNNSNVAEGVIISSKLSRALDKVVLVTFATDYVSYCGIYSCKEEGDVHFPQIAFWSRNHSLSDDKVQEMKDIISKYDKLDISDLKLVNHENCPN